PHSLRRNRSVDRRPAAQLLHFAAVLLLLQALLLCGLWRARALSGSGSAECPGEEILEAGGDGFAVLMVTSVLSCEQGQRPALVDPVRSEERRVGAEKRYCR